MKGSLTALAYPLFILTAIALTKFYTPDFILRYDLLFALNIVFLVVLFAAKYLRKEHLIPIAIFSAMGFLLEIYKVGKGIWAYPGEGLLVILGVPLCSAFLYTSVIVYVIKTFEAFKIRVINWPENYSDIFSVLVIYANFFIKEYFYDFRLPILILLIILFWKSKSELIVNNRKYSVSFNLKFISLGLFVWLAENFSTFFSAWIYNDQGSNWTPVSMEIFLSWILMGAIAVIIAVNRIQTKEKV